MPADPRIEQFNIEVGKILDFLHGEYAKLQTGRATSALVESVEVEAYGQKQELKTIAGISIEDARTITIQPWDKGVASDIERALIEADLGTSPNNDGVVIRIVLPPMTEERREQLKKLVAKLAEDARISVRQRRQDVHDDIKDNEKDEDVKFTLLDNLEEAVKAANEKIEQSMKQKEEEVMTV